MGNVTVVPRAVMLFCFEVNEDTSLNCFEDRTISHFLTELGAQGLISPNREGRFFFLFCAEALEVNLSRVNVLKILVAVGYKSKRCL